MSKPRLACEPRGHGRWGMRLTCPDHPDFIWSFDGESWEPGQWERALQIAYGHFVWAHGAPRADLTALADDLARLESKYAWDFKAACRRGAPNRAYYIGAEDAYSSAHALLRQVLRRGVQ